MKANNKKKVLTLSLYIGFAASLAGSFCGTFAWYTYGMRVPVMYEGVSIGDYGSLEIGLISEAKLTQDECNKYALIADYSYPGKNIYWSSGSVQSSTIAYIQKKNGYAHDYLRPITAGRYSMDSDTEIVLKNAPSLCKTYMGQIYQGQVVQASKDNYTKLELAFKYRADESSSEFNDHFSVYLSSANVSSDTQLHKGVRMILEGDGKKLLVNPNSTINTSLDAGGHLDLDNDGYYDAIERVSLSHYEEFAYGEFKDGELFYKDTPYPSDVEEQPTEENIESTFNALPKPGVYQIDYESSFLPRIEFYGMAKVLDHNFFTFANSDPNFKDHYAFGNIVIYLEGWDQHVDNKEVLNDFSFDLLFEAI